MELQTLHPHTLPDSAKREQAKMPTLKAFACIFYQMLPEILASNQPTCGS